MKRLSYLIFGISMMLSSVAKGQQWEVGINGGATGFMGDVNPDNPFYLKNASGGFFLKRNFNSTWGVQLAYNYVQLYGNDKDDKDPYRNARGHLFYNKVHELALRGDFNFFRYIPDKEFNRYTPYLFAGLGAIKHNPYVNIKDGGKHNLADLQLQENNSIKKIAPFVVVGTGFKYNIKGPWTIGAEVGYRTVFNNDIDNISNKYPQYSAVDAVRLPEEFRTVIASGDPTIPSEYEPNALWLNLAYPNGDYSTYQGKAKGHGRKRDGYMTVGFTLSFTFLDKRCYWWL